MKLSEIEALRDTLTVLPTAAGRREFYTLTPSAFERLLQEREMLLEALREVAHGCDCLDHAAEARTAVERAES